MGMNDPYATPARQSTASLMPELRTPLTSRMRNASIGMVTGHNPFSSSRMRRGFVAEAEMALEKAIRMQIEEDHRQAFHLFVTAVHESKVRKRRAQLALAHGLTRTQKTSFKAWGQVSRELHRWRCVKRVAYTVLGHLKLYFRFEEWSAESKFRAARRRKIGRVIGRLRDSRRSHAFHAFQEACMHHRGHRNRVKAAVLKMKNHRCHSAFNAFKEFHKHCKTGRSRANRAIKRALMHTEMRAWNVWNEVVGTSKERKTLTRKVIARLALRHLHTAFEGFVHALDEHKRRDSLLARAALRMKHHASARMIESWYDLVHERRRQKHIVHHVRTMITHRWEVMCFDAWHDFMDHQHVERHRIMMVLRNHDIHLIDHVFHAWFAQWQLSSSSTKPVFVMQQLHRHNTFRLVFESFRQFVWDEHDRRRELMRVTTFALAHAERRVFSEWWAVARVGEVKRRREAGKRFIRHMKRELVYAMEDWYEAAHHQKSMRRLLDRQLKKVHHAVLIEFSRAWLMYVLKEHYIQHRAQLILARIFRQFKSEVFWAWYEEVQDVITYRDLAIGKAVMRRKFATLHMYALAWHLLALRNLRISRFVKRHYREHFQQTMVHWARYVRKQKHLRARMRVVAMRIIMHAERRAIEAWSEFAVKQGVIRRKCSRLIKDRAIHILQHVVRAWKEETVESGARRRRFRNLQRKKLFRGLHSYFTGWCDQHAEAKARQRIHRRALHRVANVMMVKVFDLWIESFGRSRSVREAARRALRRWPKRIMGAAFQSMKENVGLRKRLQQSATRVLKRMQHGRLGRAMAQWMRFRSREANAKRRVQAMSKAGAAFRKRTVRMAMNAWSSKAQQLRHSRRVLIHATNRMTRFAMCMAWDAWSENHQMVRSRRKFLRQTFAKISLRAAGSALRGWKSRVSFLTSRKRAARAVLGRMRKQREFAAFNSWKQVQTTNKRHRSSTRRMILRWSKRSYAPAFLRWRTKVRKDKLMRQKASKVVRRWRLVNLLGAYRSWLTVARADKEAFAKIRKATWLKFYRYWRQIWREGKQHRLIIAVKKGVREGVLRGELERRRHLYRRLWRITASGVLHQKRMRREMAYAFKCDLRRGIMVEEFGGIIAGLRRRNWRLAIKACEWHVAAKVARRIGYDKQRRMRDELDELRSNMHAQERLKTLAESEFGDMHEEIYRLQQANSEFDMELSSTRERLAQSRWRTVYRYFREDKFKRQGERTRQVAASAVRKVHSELRNTQERTEKEDTTLRASVIHLRQELEEERRRRLDEKEFHSDLASRVATLERDLDAKTSECDRTSTKLIEKSQLISKQIGEFAREKKDIHDGHKDEVKQLSRQVDDLRAQLAATGNLKSPTGSRSTSPADRRASIELATSQSRLANAEVRREKAERQLAEVQLSLQEKQMSLDSLKTQVDILQRKPRGNVDEEVKVMQDQLLSAKQEANEWKAIVRMVRYRNRHAAAQRSASAMAGGEGSSSTGVSPMKRSYDFFETRQRFSDAPKTAEDRTASGERGESSETRTPARRTTFNLATVADIFTAGFVGSPSSYRREEYEVVLQRPLGIILNARRSGELSVEDVAEGTNAHGAGVKAGDVLLRVESADANSSMQVFNASAGSASVTEALDYISLCGAKDRKMRLRFYRLHGLGDD